MDSLIDNQVSLSKANISLSLIILITQITLYSTKKSSSNNKRKKMNKSRRKMKSKTNRISQLVSQKYSKTREMSIFKKEDFRKLYKVIIKLFN